MSSLVSGRGARGIQDAPGSFRGAAAHDAGPGGFVQNPLLAAALGSAAAAPAIASPGSAAMAAAGSVANPAFGVGSSSAPAIPEADDERSFASMGSMMYKTGLPPELVPWNFQLATAVDASYFQNPYDFFWAYPTGLPTDAGLDMDIAGDAGGMTEEYAQAFGYVTVEDGGAVAAAGRSSLSAEERLAAEASADASALAAGAAAASATEGAVGAPLSASAASAASAAPAASAAEDGSGVALAQASTLGTASSAPSTGTRGSTPPVDPSAGGVPREGSKRAGVRFADSVEGSGSVDSAASVSKPVMLARRGTLTRTVSWRPPDVKRARESADANHPRMTDVNQKPVPWPVCATHTGRLCKECFDSSWLQCLCGLCCGCERSKSELARYGPGISLYFKFVKWLTWMFLLLTLTATPSLVLNAFGTGSQMSTADLRFDSLSIGNLGDERNVTAIFFPGTDCGDGQECSIAKADAAQLYAVLDLIGMVLFIAGFLWMRVMERHEVRQVDENWLTVEDYSVMVDWVPTYTTEEDLKRHFRGITGNDVVEVHIAEDNTDLLKIYIERGHITRKLEALQDRLARERFHQGNPSRIRELEAECDALTSQFRELTAAARRLPAGGRALKAFVTFNTIEDARQVLEEYRKGSWARYCCLPRRLYLAHTPVQSATASDALAAAIAGRAPSTNAERRVPPGLGAMRSGLMLSSRRMGQGSSSSSVGALASANAGAAPSTPPVAIRVKKAPPPSTILWQNLNHGHWSRLWRRFVTLLVTVVLLVISFLVVLLASVQQKQVKEQGGDTPCAEDATGALIQVSRAEAENATSLVHCYCKQLSPTEVVEESLCTDWLTAKSVATAITVLASLVVVGVNSSLSGVLTMLANFERHHSLEGQAISFAKRLLISQFINTAIVVLLVNAYLPGLPRTGSAYSDFTSEWYATVGASLCVTMLVNTISPHVHPMVRYAYAVLCARTDSAEQKVSSQRELNDRFTGPQFHLGYRYAQLLNTTFVTLLYSAGLPLLLPLAVLSFFLSYWVDKFLFLRFYRLPPRYDVSLGRSMSALLPIGILSHLAFAVWMFGNQQIFWTEELKIASIQSDVSAAASTSAAQPASERIQQAHVLPIFLVFLMTLVLLVLNRVLAGLLRFASRFFSVLTCGTCTSEDDVDRNLSDVIRLPFFQAKDERKLHGLPTYNVLMNPDLQDRLALNKSFAARKKAIAHLDEVAVPSRVEIRIRDEAMAEQASKVLGLRTSSEYDLPRLRDEQA